MSFFWSRDYAKGSRAISGPDLAAALRDAFAGHAFALQLDDGAYRAIPADSFAEMVERFRWDDPPPHPQKFDCDDYAATFLADLRRAWANHSKCDEALAFGSAWVQFGGHTDTHRLIWQYDGAKVHLWEPQSNKRTAQALGVVYEVRA